MKTAYLEELLPKITRRYDGVEAVDLRFARRIILQPCVRTARRSGAAGHLDAALQETSHGAGTAPWRDRATLDPVQLESLAGTARAALAAPKDAAGQRSL